MRKKILILAPIFLMALVQASAHHGYASYDMTKMMAVRGTVVTFEWLNPHSILTLSAKDEKGGVQKWLIATGPAAMLERCGWSNNGQSSGSRVKDGDEVAVVGYRARSGADMMILSQLILPDGKQLSANCER